MPFDFPITKRDMFVSLIYIFSKPADLWAAKKAHSKKHAFPTNLIAEKVAENELLFCRVLLPD